MQKLIIILIGCTIMALCQDLFGQASTSIKHHIEAVEGTNFLRHGPFNYELEVRSSEVLSAKYGNEQMAKIADKDRIDTIQKLLGEEGFELYTNLSCECLSIWQLGTSYMIFEVSNEARREDYTVGYHIIEP